MKGARFNGIGTSDGTETSILAVTSKARQSVAHYRHVPFSFDFSVKERTYLGILHLRTFLTPTENILL